MLFFPRLIVVIAMIVLVAGAAIGSLAAPAAEKPPSLRAAAAKSKDPSRSFPSPGDLDGPWYRPEPPRPAAAPPKTVLAPAPPVDRGSLVNVGRLTDARDVTFYFFKQLSTGRVLILAAGEPRDGWTLVEVTQDEFRIEGPGGVYEIAK